jgi:DNA-binding MarR family transcriptional regulator
VNRPVKTETRRTAVRTEAEEIAELSETLLQATRALVGIAAQAAIDIADVTLAQLRVLVVLATRGRHTVGALAEVLGINPSGVTRLTDRLVGKGLVDKVESDQDRRVTHLDVTEKGHRLVMRVTDRRRAAIDALVAKIPRDRRAILIEALRTLAEEAGEPEAYRLLPWPFSG